MREPIGSQKSHGGSQKLPIGTCAIIGVGMMGGSLGMALKAEGLAERIVGIDRSETTLDAALASGAIDSGTTDPIAGAAEADCIVLAVPVDVLPALLERIRPHVRPDTLVTDIGSVKSRIVETGARLFGVQFVGGHPMAGSERSGIAAARADLFRGAAWAIVTENVNATPDNAAPDNTFVARLTALVSALGAIPICMNAVDHDRIAALVSHLPHLLSFAYADTIAADPESELVLRMAGGSFRDLMRVSDADPALWQAIFHENKEWLRAALTAYETHLRNLRETLEAGQ